MPDSPGFWDSLSNGYAFVKGKVSEGATWTEKRVTQTADNIQNQLDQTDPVGSAEFGLVRGASGVLYNAAKGTVGTVVDVGEAAGAGAKWIYNNPQQAWQTTQDAALYANDVMSDPNKMLALAQQGGGLVYTKLAGLTKQQWEEFKGDIANANTPGEMGQVEGKWATKLALTVYAVRSAIQGLKAICEGEAAVTLEKNPAGNVPKGDSGAGAADQASEAATKGSEAPAPSTANQQGLQLRANSRLDGDEILTGQRLAQQEGLQLTESEHIGAEYVDTAGKSYDAMGTPKAYEYFNQKQFQSAIDDHILKSNHFTAIDLTGASPDQATIIKNYVGTLDKAKQAKVIFVGQ